MVNHSPTTSKLFGTDGIRGKAGEFPLDESSAFTIGKSLAKHLSKNGVAPKFVTGRDTRESGNWLERALHHGAKAGGANCESAGVITTPGVAFITREFGFDAGIVISASHNPFYDNGIKIFTPTGIKFGADIEKKIEHDIHSQKPSGEFPKFREPINDSRAVEFQNSYAKNFHKEFPKLALGNLKLVIDCANGAASEIAPRIFSEFGANLTKINAEPNGQNINENCGSLHMDSLRERVIADSADIGIGFDGDADRALFIDDKGEFVDGDAVMWAMAHHLKSHSVLKDDKVVATVMSNLGLEVALRENNIELIRTPVGDKYVLERLLSSGLSIGGEQSGHIIFPFCSLVGDGILTALFLLEAMQEQGKKLSELTIGLKRFPQILLNVKVKEKRDFEQVAEIERVKSEVEQELGQRGRLLLRYSGTENLARVMIEGEDQTIIEAKANRLAAVIRETLG